jgi:SagB-type dehydrogenase family enzyme
LKLYLVTKNVTGIPAGIYKYNVQKHALEKCIDGDHEAELCPQPCVTNAAANIVICGVYEQIAKKYADGAQRYTHMEVGCVAENVYLQAVSCGVGTVFVAGFDTNVVKNVLKAPADEQPLCILPLGKIN